MWIIYLPLIILAVEILVVMPIPLYVAGKMMHLPIRYFQALSITFFAGLLASIAAAFVNMWAGLVLFLGILYYELHTKFRPGAAKIILIILIDLAVVVGIEFVKPYLFYGGLSMI